MGIAGDHNLTISVVEGDNEQSVPLAASEAMRVAAIERVLRQNAPFVPAAVGWVVTKYLYSS